jgi:hypothetical protein
MLSFTATGFEGARLLGEFRFQLAAHRWADEAEPIVLAALQRNAPVSKGPGSGRRGGGIRLRDSFHARRHVTPAGVGIEVTSSAPHARYVMGGTRAHVIGPHNARALYWVDSGGGHFARLVHHPGTRANPFAARALRPLEPLLARRFEDTIRRALTGR